MLKEQRLAAGSVQRVLEGRSLTPTLVSLFAKHPRLTTSQRAAIWDITHGVLRELGLITALMTRLVRKPVSEIALRALVVTALYQLAFTRAAHYAVVDAAVSNAETRWPWAKGMVNAVLRRFLREREALMTDARSELTAKYSYPNWWITRVRETYPETWPQVLDAGNARAPISLRVNQRRASRDAYLERLIRAGILAHAVDQHAITLDQTLLMEQLPGFNAGEVSIQDVGAQFAAHYLDLAEGQRVLDACAAPGGKTAHILELANVELLALDNDPARLARVDENLARLGLSAHTRCVDACALAQWWDGAPFDRILLDVPCTGSGVVRRHPDIKWLRREADIENLALRARALLESMSRS